MEKKKQSFKKFLEANGTDGIKKIAIEYATENDAITLMALADKYNLTYPAIKKIIEYSIVNCLVSYRLCLFVKGKAHRNQVRHCNGKIIETSSDIYYGKLLKKRISTVKKFDDERIQEVVYYYIDNPQLSGHSIADALGLSQVEMTVALKKAIIFNIIEDETFKKLEKIAISKANCASKRFTHDLFIGYKRNRKYFKLLTSKIAELTQLMGNTSLLTSSGQDAKQIEVELSNAKASLQSFIDAF